jgi:septum formation protein
VRLILASASPRRAELLAAAGFSFEIAPAEIDESPRPGEPPDAYALRVACEKAHVVAGRLANDDVAVLAADTVVVAGGRVLGKPTSAADAASMLRSLAGSIHTVHTAVALRVRSRELCEVATTRVRMSPLTAAEIEWYVGTGEPEGKAGAYAIQGRAARFVESIEGSWSTVVGLPVATVYRMLAQVGVISSLKDPIS